MKCNYRPCSLLIVFGIPIAVLSCASFFWYFTTFWTTAERVGKVKVISYWRGDNKNYHSNSEVIYKQKLCARDTENKKFCVEGSSVFIRHSETNQKWAYIHLVNFDKTRDFFLIDLEKGMMPNCIGCLVDEHNMLLNLDWYGRDLKIAEEYEEEVHYKYLKKTRPAYMAHPFGGGRPQWTQTGNAFVAVIGDDQNGYHLGLFDYQDDHVQYTDLTPEQNYAVSGTEITRFWAHKETIIWYECSKQACTLRYYDTETETYGEDIKTDCPFNKRLIYLWDKEKSAPYPVMDYKTFVHRQRLTDEDSCRNLNTGKKVPWLMSKKEYHNPQRFDFQDVELIDREGNHWDFDPDFKRRSPKGTTRKYPWN